MTDEKERRHDYIDFIERLTTLEVKVDQNAGNTESLRSELVSHALREEEAAVHREARQNEKLDRIYTELRTLQDDRLARKSKNALLAMLGAGLVALATIVIQTITGFRH